MGKQSRAKAARRRARLEGLADPMAFLGKYETAKSVFERPMEAAELVARVASYSWKEAFIRLAHLAAVMANDGSKGKKAQRQMLNGLGEVAGSDRALIARGRWFAARARENTVIAHEEAISLVQHLVLLHGGSEGPAPADSEIALWLLGAGDHLDTWAEADTRALSDREKLIAVQARVSRFNRSIDSYRGIVRTFEILRTAPRTGPLSGKTVWAELQQAAFGEEFESHFTTKALPLFMLSHAWGTEPQHRNLPFVAVAPGGVGAMLDAMGGWAKSEARTREDLCGEIRRRMLPGATLPHAPTALLHHPLVLLDEAFCVAASPWMLQVQLQTGLWARYLEAAKKRLGNSKGGMEWTRAFGQMFEAWLGAVASMAAVPGSGSCGDVLLPSHPGAQDEIEDVVLVEPTGTVLFSGKSTLVRESVARHGESRSAIMDWYEKFFFGEETRDFSAGAVRLLSANIDRIRAGAREPRVSREARLFPVLVTFDRLGESPLLYEWLAKRCADLNLLQQDGVGALTIAYVQEFEKLMLCAGDGRSVVALLRMRGSRWANARLDVQLFAEGLKSDPPPALSERYDSIVNGMSMALFGRRIRA